jgi:hypothetical protein
MKSKTRGDMMWTPVKCQDDRALAPGPEARDAAHVALRIHLHRGVLLVLRHGQQDHGGHRPRGPVRRHHRAQVHREEDVTVEDDEVVAREEVAQAADASTGCPG